MTFIYSIWNHREVPWLVFFSIVHVPTLEQQFHCFWEMVLAYAKIISHYLNGIFGSSHILSDCCMMGAPLINTCLAVGYDRTNRHEDMRVYRYTGILLVHVVHPGGPLFRSSHPCCRVAHLLLCLFFDLILQQRVKLGSQTLFPEMMKDREREIERERDRDRDREW